MNLETLEAFSDEYQKIAGLAGLGRLAGRIGRAAMGRGGGLAGLRGAAKPMARSPLKGLAAQTRKGMIPSPQRGLAAARGGAGKSLQRARPARPMPNPNSAAARMKGPQSRLAHADSRLPLRNQGSGPMTQRPFAQALQGRTPRTTMTPARASEGRLLQRAADQGGASRMFPGVDWSRAQFLRG
jgi:hypothetical protein